MTIGLVVALLGRGARRVALGVRGELRCGAGAIAVAERATVVGCWAGNVRELVGVHIR